MAIADRIGFRGRLVSAMVALVAIVSLSIGALLMLYLFEDEKSRATEQLSLGERVAEETLQRRTSLIFSRLDVVVRDFGFRSAMASRDRVTADSALENQSRRVGARFAMIIDSDGNTLAAADEPPSGLVAQAATLNLLAEAQVNGFASQMVVLDDRAVELVTIPVEAPGLRAQLIAGFGLGRETTDVIERLSGTDVLFRTRDSEADDYRFLTEAMDIEETRLAELADVGSGPQTAGSFVTSAHFFTRIVSLSENASNPLQLLLLINRDASLNAYYQRAIEILLLVSSVLVLAALIAMIMARSLGQPVLSLARYAKAIGDGESPEPPPIKAGGELAELRHALGEMLLKLRDREEQIRYAASHDEITGLPNVHAFLNSVRESLRNNETYRLFGLRINELPNINDTLGLAFGDKVLRAVAGRLSQELPEHSELARTGGGEFLMLAEACTGEALDRLAHQILDAVQAPMQIDSTPFALRCTMVSLQLPEDAQDTDQVRRRLNLTFEMAQTTRQRITHYQPGRDENHLRELQIIADLTTAISSMGLHMNYQPKLAMADGRPKQVEALVRWIHPDLGFISPEEFIFLAEQSGQITELTRHILARVAEDARAWHRAGLDIGVAINLSALDLTRPELIDEVADAFADWPMAMSDITLEVTESALMEDPETALETLGRLRALGVTLSVDDFGTGYSSLSQLRKLPVQELKIDKSFVLRLDTEPQDQLIVKSTIDMAHGLGLSIVAEGIENREAWHLLKQWGCETGQGFYMSRPVGAEELPATLQALQALKPELVTSGETTS
ncbi:putative bifunctional diguanylate cyclase/phosphodiesterase [Marinobacter confluentis]|uniref:EAL domain-containing protein n=1 Tax=Marinobacter confluentis TaxID=1697557 RepID=A0A4Z1C0M1_9GAMM|nr:GGDEF domain-containing protein [Marinobacter confluentis]TGN39433.1 EAL domain-containing protein [Marinobacter confluentis]